MQVHMFEPPAGATPYEQELAYTCIRARIQKRTELLEQYGAALGGNRSVNNVEYANGEDEDDDHDWQQPDSSDLVATTLLRAVVKRVLERKRQV